MQDKLQELFDRLDANLAEFRKTWETSDKARLIDGSREITAIWTCMGYTVLLCFTLFKTGSLSKSIFNSH